MERIITVLSKQPSYRSPSERSFLYNTFSTYTFFENLQESDESGGTFKECVNSLAIETHSNCVSLPSAVYIILKGKLTFNVVDIDSFQRSMKTHSSNNLPKLKSEANQEKLLFEPGSIFGQISKNRTYKVNMNESCCFAVLHNEVYNEIVERQENLLAEKIDLLKKLEIFRNWSRKALENAARAFNKITYRKGEVVYKEKDYPDFVFIVVSGEFKLSQSFVPRGEADEQYEFGNLSFLKGKKLKERIKRSELQVIIKQKGDIFAYSEILEKKDYRELSCVCHSKYGELLGISEKEFNKKFSHPETLRVLEEQNSLIQRWTSNRLFNLKSIEKFKVKLAYTPKSALKIPKRDSNPSRNELPSIISLTPTPKLPQIFMNILYNKTPEKRERSFKVFRTEL